MRRVWLVAAAMALGLVSAAPAAGAAGGAVVVPVSQPAEFAGCAAAGLDGLLPAGAVEPTVVSDPDRRQAVVAAWTQRYFRGIVAGVSRDGGRRWRRVVVGGLTRCTGGEYDYADDVALAAGPGGAVYLTAHAFDAGRLRSAVLTSRSGDGGRSWSPPVVVAANPATSNAEYAGGAVAVDGRDPRWVYAAAALFSYPDAAGGQFRGRVTVARSRDGGRSWSAGVALDTGDGGLTTGHQLAVLPDHTVVDVFTAIDVRTDPQHPVLHIAEIRSRDGGRTWSAPDTVADLNSVGVTDPDSGDAVAGGTRLQPAVAVDPSTGRVFIAWQDARFGGGRVDAIALTWSTPGGGWSRPVRVNATPTGIPLPDQQAFSPALAVAAHGGLAIVYSDLRFNTPGTDLPTDRWLLRCPATATATGFATAPGGCAETRLTPTSFDMRQAHQFVQVGPPGFFLGDYQGLTATAGGFLAVVAVPHPDNPGTIYAASVTAAGARSAR